VRSNMLEDESSLELLREIANEHGTPCFVYFMDHVAQRIKDLRTDLRLAMR
jgi:diaminopimelate decarboxylase